MKKMLFCLTGILTVFLSNAQNDEFQVYPNGLIYSEQTMKKLTTIVDSLNLKYKTCDLNKEYYSLEQTTAHKFRLSDADIKEAKKELEAGISFEEFKTRYPKAVIDENVLVLRYKYTNYEDKEIAELRHFNLKSDYGYKISSEDLSLMTKNVAGKWEFKYSEKTEYSIEQLEGFYFPSDFQSKKLPEKYAWMVGYTDCLIDTNSAKIKEDAERGYVSLPGKWEKMSMEKKKSLLDDMRSTRVIGQCSMDDSPRTHAVNIAVLSADTYSWEVFLKAHLDIMNDRFERMSDGSYAWGKRETYIRELEELNINVTDLLLGITIRVKNAAKHHYYGSIGRLGRALTETKNPKEVEDAMLNAIADNELDDYNRMLFYFLFTNYNYYISDEAVQKKNEERLAETVLKLPEYLQEDLKEK